MTSPDRMAMNFGQRDCGDASPVDLKPWIVNLATERM
jgi:hypothetical protein